MEKLIVFTEKEYNELLIKFVEAWQNQQYKGYGYKLKSNETGKEIIDKDTICGIFLLPWKNVFK